MKRTFIGERCATKRKGKTGVRKVVKPTKRYTFEEAVEIFIRAKEAEGVRERTVKDYRMYTRYFHDHVTENSEAPFYLDELTPELIREYVNYLLYERKPYEGDQFRKVKGTGLRPTSVNIRLRIYRTMCNFWYNEGYIETNPMANIKMVKTDQHEEVPGIPDEDIDRLLNYLDDRQFAEWRDKTLILLLLDTGLRINEALSLTIDQIDFADYTLLVPSEVAKNRKNREIPLTREVAKRLRELHDETCGYFGNVEHIFYNAYGEPLTPDSFRQRLTRIRRKLGIERIHPHMFRHTFARNYVLNGGDIFTLQKILDHADIQTTRKYVQVDNEHIRNQHNRFSPVKRLIKTGRRF
ncbi:tyrosine-type recombinase/integrase [Gottfriedia acidiceleris]|uniref:tyrosine-type recombinase/integrase n=1 Tax=Gottfriedia acidiceleris TaxID=371036 RepID=UPI002FFDBE0C